MHFTRGKSAIQRNAAMVLRFAKYGLAAPVLNALVRHTPLLDGDGQGAPPRTINYSADGQFIIQGDLLVGDISRRTPLDPGLRILDIGCGIGRLATALHRHRPGVIYTGFDVVRYGIEWCRKRLRDAPDFRFDHVDVRNRFYNPLGRINAESFHFPYDDNRFDLAVAISVFTHLLEDDTRRYFAEGIRTLRPGGRAYFTTFLPPDTIPQAAHFEFRHRIGAAMVERLEEPEMAVGYPLEFWEGLAAEHGARIAFLDRGSWTGQAGLPDYQDVLIFEKIR